MTPQTATFACVLFILWLLVRDAKQHKVSRALWIPLAWAVMVGSRPISYWLDYGNSFGGGDGYIEGSSFDRMLFLGLVLAGTAVLVRRGFNWTRFSRENRWLCVYFLYLCLSTTWSDDPFTSFKRWVKDIGNVIMVLVVLTEQNPIEAVKAFLGRCTFLLVPPSVLLVKYYPYLGRHYDQWTGVASFCGVTTDKNLLGMTLFVCAVSSFWILLGKYDSKARGRFSMESFTYMFMLVMTFWLIVKAQSATAIVCTLLGCVCLVGLRFPVIRSKTRYLRAYSVGIVLTLVVLHFSVNLGGIVTQLLGRNLTLTGRTDIWAELVKEPINPLLGEGFYSFWTGDRVQRISAAFFYELNESHNGYLETYLNTGLLGLALLLAMLASAGTRIQRAVSRGSDFGILQLTLLMTTIYYSLTEAVFDRLNLVWLALLIAAVNYPARTKLIARAPADQIPTGERDPKHIPKLPHFSWHGGPMNVISLTSAADVAGKVDAEP